jgi:hypothetical protein
VGLRESTHAYKPLDQCSETIPKPIADFLVSRLWNATFSFAEIGIIRQGNHLLPSSKPSGAYVGEGPTLA